MGEKWNAKYEWCFSPLGTGDKVGVNNAGIGIFKKQQYSGLAKEILQNVIDAKDKRINEPVKACFEVIYIPQNQIPGAARLSEVIKRCYDYYHEGDDGIKMGLLKRASEELLDVSDALVPVLKISDFNTSGLTGTEAEKGSNWTGLVREISATNKGNGLSGSFGVGKFAPFNFSSLRTIIYSTRSNKGEIALQGKTILTTFKDNDGRHKQNVGLFGLFEDEDCKAIYNFDDVPDVYHRLQCGTDLFVLGFKEDDDWMQQITISVLEYFFYTIFKGNLEVSIKRGADIIQINKEKLPDLIAEYKDYCEKREITFSVPNFWELLNDETGKTKHFVEKFRNKGNVELYLRVDSNYIEKRILEMRAPGMKILEDTGFRIGAYFYGIFIATGEGSISDEPKDNINSFLRKCENQAHDSWSKDEYEDNKAEAERVIKAIHTWLVEKIKSEMPKIEKDEINAFGLSDLLPNQENDNGEEQEESAYASFEPLPDDTVVANKKTHTPKTSDVTIIPKKPNTDMPDDIVLFDDGDEAIQAGGQSGREKHPPHPPYPGPYPGPFPGPNPVPNPQPNEIGEDMTLGQNNKKKRDSNITILRGIKILAVKTPFDELNNIFRISFIPSTSETSVYIKLAIGSDDENKKNALIKSASVNGEALELNRGFIMIPKIEKDKKVIMNVELSNARRCLLEVKAYVE